ncbi:MAG TPA: hypothetical protein PLT67_05945 [Kiritimatiellia bacterium]|nr:hypothetical protein [Kiritimatiellia bacterium]
MNGNQSSNHRDETAASETITDYKGRAIAFYHPNGKGTGSAMRLEPRINRDDRDRYNCFFMELAGQKTAANLKAGAGVPATFDWAAKITVKLGFLDVAEILTVLEGRSDNAGGSRNGLYHAAGNGNTLISFQASREQRIYHLSISKKNGSETPRKLGITLSDTEATGLRCLLQTGLFFVTFSSFLREKAYEAPVIPFRAAAAE